MCQTKGTDIVHPPLGSVVSVSAVVVTSHASRTWISTVAVRIPGL